MKKILLVTIWDCSNYGNRLQAYALGSLLQKDLSCEVDDLVYGFYYSNGRRIKDSIKRFLGRIGVASYRCIYIETKRFRKQRIVGNEWSKKNFPRQIKVGNRYHSLRKYNFSGYDFAITGSDQVWHNWKRQDRELDYYYLRFMPEEKRLSFAPSFGFECVPESDFKNHKEGILGIKALSCRENSGCGIIYQLTGRDAILLPDPTLCLEKKEWESLSKKPAKNLPERYILIYFLGPISNDTRNSIEALARQQRLNIIDISIFNIYKPLIVDPGGFLWLVQHASVLFTDSFHGTVFSIIFQKDFYTFPRNGLSQMFGRLLTLLRQFEMTDRIVIDKVSTYTPIEKEKFYRAEKILEECRRQALVYLHEKIV